METQLSKDVQNFANWLQKQNKGTVETELAESADLPSVTFVRLREQNVWFPQNYLFAFAATPTDKITSWVLNQASQGVNYGGLILVVDKWLPERYWLEKDLTVFVRQDKVRLGKDNAGNDYVTNWLAEYTRQPKIEKKDFQDDRSAAASSQFRSYQNDYFVGREQEFEQVKLSVLTDRSEGKARLPWIFSLWGDGGSGKSYFLEQIRQAFAPRLCYVQLDHENLVETEEGLANLLADLAWKLRENGCSTSKFEEVYKNYKSALARTSSSNIETARTTVNAVAQGAGKLNLGKQVAGMFNMGGTLAEIGFNIYEHISQEERAKNDEILRSRSVEQLTSAFLKDLENFATEQRKKYYIWRRIVIAFDTYELLGPLVDKWLRTMLLKSPLLNTISPLILIAGRYELSRFNTRWTEYQDSLAVFNFKGLSLQAVRVYLQKLNVQDEAKIQWLYEWTGGLPLYLSLVANKENINSAVPILTQRVLEEVEPNWQTFFLDMAVPERFDLATVEKLSQSATESQAGFERLLSATFVEPGERTFYYRPVIRRLFLRQLELKNPARLQELKQKFD